MATRRKMMCKQIGASWVGPVAIGVLLWSAIGAAQVLLPGLGDTGGAPVGWDQPTYGGVARLPDDSYDWREHGIDLQPRDQGVCDSSYVFAAVGVKEAKLLLSGAGLHDLSEQQLISCAARQVPGGCCGGSMTVLGYFNAHPAWDECDGYPDAGTTCGGDSVPCSGLGPCPWTHDLPSPGLHTVDTSDREQIKAAVYYSGPSYLRFDVHTDFFSYWENHPDGDVYSWNGTAPYVGGHAVLLIGWDDGKHAWLCRNSWGADGGPHNDGTFWLHYDDDAQLGLAMANYRDPSPNTAPVTRVFPWYAMEQNDDSVGGPGLHPVSHEPCLMVHPDEVGPEDPAPLFAFGVAGDNFYDRSLITVEIVMAIDDNGGREEHFQASTYSETDDACPSTVVKIGREQLTPIPGTVWSTAQFPLPSPSPLHTVLRYKFHYLGGQSVYLKEIRFSEGVVPLP